MPLGHHHFRINTEIGFKELGFVEFLVDPLFVLDQFIVSAGFLDLAIGDD